jgi:hypothetical protein
MNFLELALKAAVEKFLSEIEPEIKEFRLRLDTIRTEFVELGQELAELIELFKRHLVASKLAEDDLRSRLAELEKLSPRNEQAVDENFHAS